MATIVQKSHGPDPQNSTNQRTRYFFLWCMAVVYFFAFGSLYHQIPGLYGDNGILPVKSILTPVHKTFEKNFISRPTLVWLAPALGLEVQSMLEFVALVGLALSTFCLMFYKLRNAASFFGLWMLYMSLYQVGQTFTSFQWDILLLEAGFLTILLAPLNFFRTKLGEHEESETVSLWAIRWLLFRLMFSSGVVKLTSLCPTWWQLTALTYHFESQCLPTPLAWYAHHLPAWLLKLGTVYTYVIEIPIPFLFFSPIRSLRIFSFYAQLLLQVSILLTGNYTFFNLLTAVLCISLLDDAHLGYSTSRPKKQISGKKKVAVGGVEWKRIIAKAVSFLVYSALAYGTIAFFSLKLNPDLTIDSKIAFTNQEFHKVLEKAVRVSIFGASASLIILLCSELYKVLSSNRQSLSKVLALLKYVFFSSITLWIFCISMVPHTVVDQNVNSGLWPVIRKWHGNVEKLHIVNSYGLFRRMTGVGGRPEVVIEGSNSLETGWKEYHFLYKPGNLSGMLPIVAPHQPRLDWQMWFAALGSYQQNPWFVSLVNRLLVGQKEVLALMDAKRNPFPNQPPKYIRAVQYTYQYTPAGTRSIDWWVRKKVGDYLPAISKDHPSLKEYLQSHNLAEAQQKSAVQKSTLQWLIKSARDWIGPMSAPLFLWSLLLSVGVLNLFSAFTRKDKSGNLNR